MTKKQLDKQEQELERLNYAAGLLEAALQTLLDINGRDCTREIGCDPYNILTQFGEYDGELEQASIAYCAKEVLRHSDYTITFGEGMFMVDVEPIKAPF